MKKWIALILTLGVVLALAGCTGGGEIDFEAVIDRVEDGVAYATVTDDLAGFFDEKLPEQITFSTEVEELNDVELQPGDLIYGNYLSGTIDGNSVRVVSVSILEPTE